ncbi:MAG: DUF2382 domain-containing protein [Leptolyngbyaceae cyanobacterium]
MALTKFKEAYPNHRETFNGQNVINFDDYSVYASKDDKIGSVKDALFDDMNGKIRYLIVDTGFWIFGKTVLLPIGLARFDTSENRVYINGLTKEQAEYLPEYTDNMTVDRDYEDRVRAGYRTLGESRTHQFKGKKYNADEHRAYPGSAALHGATQQRTGTSAAASDQYDYDTEPGLYGMDKDSHQSISLYQERLIADKDRFKSGTVAVGKNVKSKTQEVSVPVENERVVIERTTPTDTAPIAGNPDFHEGEVARVETYGEEANIRKEAFVREEVSVRKEVDRNTVTERETIRREELDVDTQGNPNVQKR